MATPLDTALNRMSEIRAELAELETFVRVYYRMFPQEKLSSVLPDGPRLSAPVDNGDKPVDYFDLPAKATASPGNQKRVEIAENFKMKRAKQIFGGWFEKLIMEEGRPLTRQDFLELLESRDEAPAIHSDDKLKYLGTLLWRNSETLRNLPGHGYWIKALPYIPANYDPANDTPEQEEMDTEEGQARQLRELMGEP